MNGVTLDEAHSSLPDLLGRLQPGEEIMIFENGRPLAQVKKAAATSWPCKVGSYKKADFWMAADFDAPLDDFREVGRHAHRQC